MKICSDCKTMQVSRCCDCEQNFYLFSEQELADILSALSFFIQDYPDQTVQVRKAMQETSERIWKMLKTKRGK